MKLSHKDLCSAAEALRGGGLAHSRLDLPPLNLFKAETQRTMIDACLGPLSPPLRAQSRGKYHIFKKQKNENIVNCRLPTLANPGSSMGNPLGTNTSNVIGTMNLEPMANAEELINLNPMIVGYDENYQKTRVLFLLSTFICITIILFELTAIMLGIIYTNNCQMVDIFLVVSGCIHVIIILLEWAKSWIWSSNDDPVVPDSNSDHMQIFISCILICLYSLSVVWYTVGFAWIPTVFSKYLERVGKKNDDIIIIKDGKEYIHRIPQCSENFYIFAVSYQVVIGLLFLLRIVLCCMSNFCKGLCNKFATHSATSNFKMYSENPLNEILPPLRNPLFKFGFKFDQNSTGLNTLFNVNNLCMISPIPIYPSDRTKLQENTLNPILKKL